MRVKDLVLEWDAVFLEHSHLSFIVKIKSGIPFFHFLHAIFSTSPIFRAQRALISSVFGFSSVSAAIFHSTNSTFRTLSTRSLLFQTDHLSLLPYTQVHPCTVRGGTPRSSICIQPIPSYQRQRGFGLYSVKCFHSALRLFCRQAVSNPPTSNSPNPKWRLALLVCSRSLWKL